ncbi:MAG TPA: hypothetical protein HA315_03500 [Candidatus Thalassarchaeaceae archaeon]|jgi:hypothetical protein|nr:MAG TPA: hypothetical protein D7H72_03490 [Candidatus Poseidoniales archaeon]HII35046.1 hypothetical protein [Candidatus Thalassarchaeaceae archaeon]|tara:strand:+ start:12623 stop:12928 length:306 start_codon:yes stop_codon:yes gene_type:complete
MAGPVWRNVYRLTEDQMSKLDEAEDNMEMMRIGTAEKILIGLLENDSECVPVLNVMAHLQGRYLSDFEKAIEFYDRVLSIEPDNAWARDERRRYSRYSNYD